MEWDLSEGNVEENGSWINKKGRGFGVGGLVSGKVVEGECLGGGVVWTTGRVE